MFVPDAGVWVEAMVLDVVDDGDVVGADCEDVASDGASPARLAAVDVWPVEASLVVPARVAVPDEDEEDVSADDGLSGVEGDCVDDVSPVERVVEVACSESRPVVEVDVCAERAGAAHSAIALNNAMMLIRCLLMMCPL